MKMSNWSGWTHPIPEEFDTASDGEVGVAAIVDDKIVAIEWTQAHGPWSRDEWSRVVVPAFKRLGDLMAGHPASAAADAAYDAAMQADEAAGGAEDDEAAAAAEAEYERLVIVTRAGVAADGEFWAPASKADEAKLGWPKHIKAA